MLAKPWCCRHGCRHHHRRQVGRFRPLRRQRLGRSTRRRRPSGNHHHGRQPTIQGPRCTLGRPTKPLGGPRRCEDRGWFDHFTRLQRQSHANRVRQWRRGCFGPINVFAPATGGATDVSVIDTDGNVATSVQEFMARASERLDVAEANIIISGGRGMGSPDNFTHLEAIADTIGAAVGASRPPLIRGKPFPIPCRLADRQDRQPEPVHRRGISGAIQHLAGCALRSTSSINKDADAPIFQHADYGIVATWEEALPVLMRASKA